MDIDLTTWKLQPQTGRFGGRLCRKVCPAFNSDSHSRLRQRERGERPEAKQTDRRRISPASSAAGIATPASEFPVIPDPDTASVALPRAQLHSLLRLTDANTYVSLPPPPSPPLRPRRIARNQGHFEPANNYQRYIVLHFRTIDYQANSIWRRFEFAPLHLPLGIFLFRKGPEN